MSKTDETVAHIVDSFSVHRPRGVAKGTLARRNLKDRLRKHIDWEIKTSLENYTKWLEKNGYVDSDVWAEEPTAVERYLKDTK